MENCYCIFTEQFMTNLVYSVSLLHSFLVMIVNGLSFLISSPDILDHSVIDNQNPQIILEGKKTKKTQ